MVSSNCLGANETCCLDKSRLHKQCVPTNAAAGSFEITEDQSLKQLKETCDNGILAHGNETFILPFKCSTGEETETHCPSRSVCCKGRCHGMPSADKPTIASRCVYGDLFCKGNNTCIPFNDFDAKCERKPSAQKIDPQLMYYDPSKGIAGAKVEFRASTMLSQLETRAGKAVSI